MFELLVAGTCGRWNTVKVALADQSNRVQSDWVIGYAANKGFPIEYRPNTWEKTVATGSERFVDSLEHKMQLPMRLALVLSQCRAKGVTRRNR